MSPNNTTSVTSPAALNVQAPSASTHVEGEGRTLGDLYDRFGTLAYSLAFSITGQRAAAERVVSDAFAKTWQDGRNDTSPSAFFAALMTTARASALASRAGIRSQRDAVTTTRRSGGQCPSGPSLDTMENTVALALNDLPEAQRRVLMLAYFDGLPIGEIASEVHEPLQHVKENLHAALRRLRSVLSVRSDSAGLL